MAQFTDATQVRLRPIALSDWPRVHEWAQTEQASRYQPWGPNTPGETENFAAVAVASWSARPQTRYVWAGVTPADQVVGVGEMHPRQARGIGEISYAVQHEYWGQGIGSAIARLLRDFGFEALRLHRVEATCDPRNLGSARVLRSINMVHEGTLRENLRVRDGWRDSHVFGILAHEWQVLNPDPLTNRVSLP